jgi:TPP-dependent pyruvate/acetoin dehydrogenase alpha subunit
MVVTSAAVNDAAGGSKTPLSPALLRRLYYYMLKCRAAQERARYLFPDGGLEQFSCCAVGREAMEVGATIDLQPEDTISPSHGNLLALLMKEASVIDAYAQLYGKSEAGNLEQRIRPPESIGAQVNIGTGVALAYKTLSRKNVVVSILGGASMPMAALHESLEFAGALKLPIIFVIEINLWEQAVSQGSRPDKGNLSAVAQSYGIPGIPVDGNDAVAVYRVCCEGRDRALQGYGPTLVEAMTYRWYGHPKVDPAKHRPAHEVDLWKTRDPIMGMERYLRKQNLWDDAWNKQISVEVNAEIDKAAAAVVRQAGGERTWPD